MVLPSFDDGSIVVPREDFDVVDGQSLRVGGRGQIIP